MWSKVACTSWQRAGISGRLLPGSLHVPAILASGNSSLWAGQLLVGAGVLGALCPESVPVGWGPSQGKGPHHTHYWSDAKNMCVCGSHARNDSRREESGHTPGQVRLHGDPHFVDRAAARKALPKEGRQVSLPWARGACPRPVCSTLLGPLGGSRCGDQASCIDLRGAPRCLTKPGMWDSARQASPGTRPGSRGLTPIPTVGKGSKQPWVCRWGQAPS